ncbi:hypothetical protein DFH08DRAFT_812577 [Mycena albidolilacea]|uniref:Uncharacterized protein n=1 Tax=Mycena albidolilacea TaxID=1033008 RepID=A0AAD7EM37_9AGAR|nr:hypothetical protein DFH08DRAFT_812577 [Mycena albidolilacea]
MPPSSLWLAVHIAGLLISMFWSRGYILQLEDLNITASKKLGLRAAILRSMVALGLRAVFRARGTVALGLRAAIPRSTVALRLWAVFCVAWLHLGCRRYSTRHGCARVADGILRTQHGCARVVGGYSAQQLRSGCRWYSVQHGCAWVAGGYFAAARLRSGCGRYSAQHGCTWVAGSYSVQRLRSGCGRYSMQHGCTPVAGGILRGMVALGLRETVSSELFHGFSILQTAFPACRETIRAWWESNPHLPHQTVTVNVNPFVKVPMLERRRDRSDLERHCGHPKEFKWDVPHYLPKSLGVPSQLQN